MPFTEKIKFEIRKKAFQRCCICHEIGVEIHHIIPQWNNGTDEMDNGAPLCPRCHEIYGENPTKRKFIRECRDIWYQICEERYSISNKKFDEIEKELVNIKNLLINQTKYYSKYNGEALLSIGDILDFYRQQYFDDKESFELSYDLVFRTKGDEENSSVLEFNHFRDTFLDIFGLMVAENIVSFCCKRCEIDWKKGITELKANEFFNMVYVNMLLLFMHSDLPFYEEKVGAKFNSDKTDLIYVLIK